MTPEQARTLAATAREHLATIKAPWCADWMYEAIRHCVRNVDINCPTHGDDDEGACRQPTRHEGGEVIRTQALLAALAEAVETLTAEPETDKIADKLAATVGEPNRMLPFGRLPGYIAAIRDYRIETKVELREAKDAIDAALTRRMVSGG